MMFLTCAGRKGSCFHATAFLSQVACTVVLFLTVNQYTPERGVLAHPQTSWDRAVCESPVLSLLRPFRFHLSEEFGGEDKPYYACPWPAVNSLLRLVVTLVQLLASHALMVVSLKRQFSQLWFLWWLCKYATLICVFGGAASVSIDLNQLIIGTKLCEAQFKSGDVQLIALPGYEKGFTPECDQGTYVYTAISTGVMALLCLLVLLGAELLPRANTKRSETAEAALFSKQLTMPLAVTPMVYHPPTLATVSALPVHHPHAYGSATGVMSLAYPSARTAGQSRGTSQHPGAGGVTQAIMDRADVESQAAVPRAVQGGQAERDSDFGGEERD